MQLSRRSFIIAASALAVPTPLWAADMRTVLDFGAVGDGVTNDAAAVVSCNADGPFAFPEGVYRISSNITISSDCVFEPGAKLLVDSGVTATINGRVSAPLAQIFSGSGNVVGTFGNTELQGEWFGMIPDGNYELGTGTDSGPAFQRMVNARSISTTVLHSMRIGQGVFRIGTKVDIPVGVSIRGSGRWTTMLMCNSSFTGYMIDFVGDGGPPTEFTGFNISGQVGGAYGAGGIRARSNGTMLRELWLNGLSVGAWLHSTDIKITDWIAEYCSIGVHVTSPHVMVTEGIGYKNRESVVVDTSGQIEPGAVHLTNIKSTKDTDSGFWLHNATNVIMTGCSAGHWEPGCYLKAGLLIDGNSHRITVADFRAEVTFPDAEGDGIAIMDPAGEIILDNCYAKGFRNGLLISTFGVNVQVNGGAYNFNRKDGINARGWTGTGLQIVGANTSYNGSPGGGDAGVAIVQNQQYQHFMMSSVVSIQNGGGDQEYGIYVAANHNLSGGQITSCRTAYNSVSQIAVTGAHAANIALADNY